MTEASPWGASPPLSGPPSVSGGARSSEERSGSGGKALMKGSRPRRGGPGRAISTLPQTPPRGGRRARPRRRGGKTRRRGGVYHRPLGGAGRGKHGGRTPRRGGVRHR